MTITDPVHWIEEGFFKGPKFNKIVEMIAELNTPTVAPIAHKTSHQNGGGDEISVADLSGLLADAQAWLASTVSQSEAEAGTATTDRKWTAQRVKQAIDALGGGDFTFPQHGDTGFDGDLVWQLDLSNYASEEDYSLVVPVVGGYEVWHAANMSMRASTVVSDASSERPVDGKSLRWYRNSSGLNWYLVIPAVIPPSGSIEFDWRTDRDVIRGNGMNWLFQFQDRSTGTMVWRIVFNQDILTNFRINGTGVALTFNEAANTWYNIQIKYQVNKGASGLNFGRLNARLNGGSWGTETNFLYPTSENVNEAFTGKCAILFSYNNSGSSYYMDTFYDNLSFRVFDFDL